MFRVVFACLLFAAAASADEAPTYRELPCRVVDEVGQPVRGVAVRLGGVERGAPSFEQDEDQIDKEPGWKFTTDGDGRFTARFGQFDPFHHSGPEEAYAGPGYGRFYFLVEKAGFAGGVSREILNLDDAACARWQADVDQQLRLLWGNQEWQRGEFTPLLVRDDQLIREPLVIVLKRGLTVRGRMVDTVGRPVRGQTVSSSLDLHYDSHTGLGGTILWQEATTDRVGRFRLRHVYPNTFTLQAADGDDDGPCWIKTRVRESWFDRIEDEITPRRGDEQQPADYEKFIDLRLVVSRRPFYRYFGRVANETGHPVARTTVIFRSVLHSPVRTWSEDHGGNQRTTLTDAAGNYSVRVCSRFVEGIWVREGNHNGGIDADGDQLLAPGRYDFVVGPKNLGQ